MGLIIAILVAISGFLSLFHALISVTLFTCIHADPNMALISPETDQLIILVGFSAAWVLGFFQKNMFALRHLGTRYYGREETDQGYITTKWLTAGFPLLPIRSYIVSYHIKEVFNPEFEYQKNVMKPIEGYFHWQQMLRTALISYGTMLWCWGCLWLMFNSSCF